MKLPATITGSDGISRTEFESLSQMIQCTVDTQLARCATNAKRANALASRAGPFLKMLENVPADLLAKAEKVRQVLLDHVEMPMKKMRMRRRRLESGDELDMDAYVRREADGWTDIIKEKVSKPIVKIAVNWEIMSYESDDALLYRGALAAVLTDVMTQAGHSVELVAFESATGVSDHLNRYLTKVVIKASDQPLNYGSCIVALSTSGFFGNVVLPIDCRLSETAISYGLGRSANLPAEDVRDFDFVIDRSDVRSLEMALNFIKTSLNSRLRV